MSLFIIFMIIMLIADVVWLNTMVPLYYASRLKGIISGFSFIPAAFFYVLYTIGVSIFVLMPAVYMRLGYFYSFLYGALFGLVAYGTYDLTNQATISTWPIDVTLVDMLWGSLATGLATALSLWVFRTFLT